LSQPHRQPAPRSALQQRVTAAILEAAAEELAARGAQASMADVSRAAGVARATVYRYFPSRQVLLDELAQVALEGAEARLTAAAIEDVPLREGVARAVRALVDVGPSFVVLARERAGSDAADFDRCVSTPLRRLIERGQSNGDVRADVASSWLAEALVGLVVSVPQARPARGRDDTIAAIASLYLDGAGPGAAASR
jgi:AcrR family transcriptional regulator